MAGGIMKKLPEDIIVYVLSRFPVKSLMRLKSISKSWYILIDSSSFTHLHLNHINNEFILLTCSVYEEEYEKFKTDMSFLSNDSNDNLNPFNQDFQDCDVSELTAAFSSNFDEFIGPSHGLIALVGSIDTVIFNPTTRHYRVLPPSPFDCPEGFYHDINGLGFGFDPMLNDYKVVRISKVYTDPYKYSYHSIREKKVEVYDMWVDSWRELDILDQQLPGIYWLPCSQKFYKGSCHWFTNTTDDNSVAVFCFDITTETFRIMNMPDCCHFFYGPRYGLVILIECLTLICYHDREPQVDPSEDMIDIWIMKEYGVSESWIKKYTIQPLPIEYPLAGWKDYLLYFQSTRGLLISYNLHSDEVKELILHGFSGTLRVVVYTESLIQIPRGRDHSRQVKHFHRTYNSSTVT
ncbi:F-box protein CPR30-like [Solanum tuberosum]|uniref:Class S F-box protein n=1 Tax=Solanum tuberosum TaxID=4113 RepID=M1AK40_SOLTU|nr:PREDICTED: F-box protein CPR30-like [Solanum tuberosum]